MNSCEIYL